MATGKRVDGGSPKPNIKLAEGATPATIEGEVMPPGATRPLLFPDLDNQRAGWYAPNAAEIVRYYPDRYKPMISLGGGN